MSCKELERAEAEITRLRDGIKKHANNQYPGLYSLQLALRALLDDSGTGDDGGCSYCDDGVPEYHMCQDCMDSYQKMDGGGTGFVKPTPPASDKCDCNQCDCVECADVDSLGRARKARFECYSCGKLNCSEGVCFECWQGDDS